MKDHLPLNFIFTEDGFTLDYDGLAKKGSVIDSFTSDRYNALYQWGFQNQKANVHPSALFLYQVSEAFINALTKHAELEVAREKCCVPCDGDIWHALQEKIPFVLGSEYITQDWVANIFQKLNDVFAHEAGKFEGTMKLYLAQKNQDLKTPERIFFHLVESKEEDFPFAFMATYATKNEEGNVHHLPLKYALQEYKHERSRLLSLLSCLNAAAKQSDLIARFMENGELFHPLALSAQEAFQLLKDIEKIEACGILCRIPNWWRKKYASVSLKVQMGDDKPSLLGFQSILSLQPKLVVDGVELTKKDIKQLLQQSEGLAFLKGKWVEVNHEALHALLKQLEEHKGEITLMEAIQMNVKEVDRDLDNGVYMSNGKWLSSLLQNLRTPANLEAPKKPEGMKATLRPYQETGYSWLHYMKTLGFGACLADDMGLGKTIQVLTFLERLREEKSDASVLLVVPASLLGNWEKEAEKFTPDMEVHILHGRSKAILVKELLENHPYVSVTTYGMVTRLPQLAEKSWDCIILDEAQAIKNPLTAQTKAIKKLKGDMRIALTGTPIENELANLWSLFDFLNKGLLGTSSEFKEITGRIQEDASGYAHLKAMISPFILRRLKTDKRIISDLPDKIETVDYVSLTKQQIVLYRKALADFEAKLEKAKGIERRGLVLGVLIKLKQICNHPDQYLGGTGYAQKDSGKFAVLKEICETIHEKRERVLVFTQYTEIIPYLQRFLTKVFHKEGYIIDGSTPVKKRNQIVEQFNQEAYVPYVLCSLRAAGVGLNLTAANHVIHFDRWWNPAVENQATDRAFRIGQKKNVLVHKFVCEGTVEEKIDALINSKKELSEQVIGSGKETWITEMNNEELMSILRLKER